MKMKKLHTYDQYSLNTQLNIIMEHNQQELLDYEINSGKINVCTIVSLGRNVLQYIIENSEDEFDLTTIINHTKEINHQDNDFYSALMIAMDLEHFNYIKQLLKTDINWNIKNKNEQDFLEIKSGIKSEVIEYIKENYSDKYKQYLSNKKAIDFNL